MKLFKRLLVAPAALGLLAPVSAIATEVNLNDISNYSDGEFEINSNTFVKETTVNTLLSGGEGLVVDSVDSDSFSETTTASFSADFAIGALDGAGVTATNRSKEAVQATYGFQIDLNTSFTGEDSLDVSIDAGNGSSSSSVAEFDLNTGSDALTVDGVSYTFPLGDKTTVIVGDNTDGSALYSTACVYGGPSNTLDDCGNVNAGITGGGTALGASFDIGGGFTAALGYAGAGSSTAGLLTTEGDDAYGGQLTYTADSYGASVTYGLTESAGVNTTSWALNGYWTPSETGSLPSLSLGYETDDSEDDSVLEKTSYFIGLQWDEVGPGTFGVAAGTSTPTPTNAEELLMYEAFYSYPVNDVMTITPVVYVKEASSADETGVMVKTSFSF